MTSLIAAFLLLTFRAAAAEPPNPLIDYDKFASNVTDVAVVRERRRISEQEFLRMASDPVTVILDARSSEKFALLHVKGARNLSLPDITQEELARIIPSKRTRVLIYCNNNFINEPAAFPTKLPAASLNIHTFNVLHAYGYENVYELGPVLDARRSKLPLEGTAHPPAGDGRSR